MSRAQTVQNPSCLVSEQSKRLCRATREVYEERPGWFDPDCQTVAVPNPRREKCQTWVVFGQLTLFMGYSDQNPQGAHRSSSKASKLHASSHSQSELKSKDRIPRSMPSRILTVPESQSTLDAVSFVIGLTNMSSVRAPHHLDVDKPAAQRDLSQSSSTTQIAQTARLENYAQITMTRQVRVFRVQDPEHSHLTFDTVKSLSSIFPNTF